MSKKKYSSVEKLFNLHACFIADIILCPLAGLLKDLSAHIHMLLGLQPIKSNDK